MPPSHSRAWTALVPLVAVAAFIGLVVLASGGKAPPADGGATVTVDDVVAQPDRYDNHQLVLTGRVAKILSKVPKRLRGAFVLASPGGGRLVVAPPPAGLTDKPSLHDEVDVRGFVRVPEAGATTPRAALIKRTGAEGLLDAVSVRPTTG